jgi:mannitol/fructose-specific phosphotransferase system IIA component (Ntr-type)
VELQEILTPNSVYRYTDRSDDKLEFLKDMLVRTLAGTASESNLDKIWDGLREREVSMSTGIGLGVAIPHCSSEWVDEVFASIAVITEPLPFDAIDDEPVQIVVLLLMPRNRFDRHIKTLASIARMFNDESFRQKVLSADSEETIFQLIESFQDTGTGSTG